MSPAELYRRITIPTRFRVFGYSLVPFEVGHARLIDRLGIATVASGFDAAILAKLCSMPSAKAEKWVNSRWLNLWIWWMARTRKRLLGSFVECEKASKVIAEYLEESTRVPGYEAKRQNGEGESEKLVCPFAQHLRATLLSRLNYSPSEVDGTPYLVALWDYVSFMELDGHVRIHDDLEQSQEDALFEQANELMRRVQAGEVRLGS